MPKKTSSSPKLPPEFVKRLKSITAKRARTVIDHILAHGFITTEELSTKYGYDHAPRAARDVREQGIPLETFKVTATNGRRIAAYRFADPSKVKGGRVGGRTVWPKDFKNTLIALNGCRCAICSAVYEGRYLQIDHRVPYEVAGDQTVDIVVDDFMLVCGSCNRAKSWSCEHCANWIDTHDSSICRSCYWASPANYLHVAQRLVRRLDVTWTESEVEQYERLKQLAHVTDQELPEFVKAVLRRSLPPD
ncbi:MAG: HNH endonuclease [Candidatus Anammoximicrobium sp.]|nr:HNH endonuclease [Candidatus Anammoximicrobium sp.]